MVPEGWTKESVGGLITGMGAGVSVNSTDQPCGIGQHGILKTSCVSDGVFKPERNKLVEELTEVSRLREFVKGDTIVISRMNTPNLVGANGYVARDYPNLFLPDRLWALKTDPERTNCLWLSYWFSSSHARNTLTNIATGTSGSMKNISKGDVLAMEVGTPPLPEQRKIAEILSTWDRAIETVQRLLATARTQKRALMQSLLTGKRRFPEFEGQEWKEVPLSEIAVPVSKRNNGSDLPVLTISSKDGFVRQDEKFARYMAGESVKRYYILSKGQFAYNKGNSKTYPFGCVLRMDNFDEGLVPHVYVCFELKDGYDSDYYRALFLDDFLQPQLSRLVNTGVRNNGLLNISPSVFWTVKVPVPSFEEQHAIGAVINDAVSEEDALVESLEHLRTEKKALMQQLLTGKRRVKTDA